MRVRCSFCDKERDWPEGRPLVALCPENAPDAGLVAMVPVGIEDGVKP